MNGWFIWNNTKCTEYGIHVTGLPPITLRKERTAFAGIPGRCTPSCYGDSSIDEMKQPAERHLIALFC